MTRAFWRYPICRGSIGLKWFGLATLQTRASDMLQLVLRELQYVLQYVVIHKKIEYKELILLFLLQFSVAL